MHKPKIIRVQAYDDDPNEVIIELDNGSAILLELTLLGSRPAFVGSGILSRPSTDGRQICWQEGPSLTLEEILELLEGDADI